MILARVISVSAALALAGISSASANVITIGEVATLNCTPSCTAIVGGSIVDAPGPGLSGTMGSQSSSTASRYRFSPASPEEEALALNTLAGTSFATGIRTEVGSAFQSAFSFTTSALWVALKLGPNTLFIFNDSGGSLAVDFLRNGLTGSGLSHITEFGETEIPIPGAIWLMGAGIAGLGFSRRRKDAI